MKSILAFFLLLPAFTATADVRVLNKDYGTLELTGSEAQELTDIILNKPVLVSAEHYNLALVSRGEDFNGKPMTFVSGEINCKKNGQRCVVKASQLKQNGDGSFSPKPGFVRAFGMQTLLSIGVETDLYSCKPVYADFACDFAVAPTAH